MKAQRIGRIGLGAMGIYMARTLIKAAFEVAVWNRCPSPPPLPRRTRRAPLPGWGHGTSAPWWSSWRGARASPVRVLTRCKGYASRGTNPKHLPEEPAHDRRDKHVEIAKVAVENAVDLIRSDSVIQVYGSVAETVDEPR